ncbi:hypothetical protein [Nesterenkonia populi]|uniref:hypothetical protein n=1 Tax=Nesterenkonia populi TaxID=1591087 RepID=UPI0011BFC540|nr:hypothetical protein [Nesterenkonia populi]
MTVAYLEQGSPSGHCVSGIERTPVPPLPPKWRTSRWPLIEEDDEQGFVTVTFLRLAPSAHTVLLILDGLTEVEDAQRSEMEFLGDGIFAIAWRMPRGAQLGYSFYDCSGACVPWRDQADCPLGRLVDRSQADQRNPERCRVDGRELSLLSIPAERPRRLAA